MVHYELKDYVIVNAAYFAISALVLSFAFLVIPSLFESWYNKQLQHSKRRMWFIGSAIGLIGILIFTFKIGFGYYEFTAERVVTGALSLAFLGAIPLIILHLANKHPNAINNQHIDRKIEIGNELIPVSKIIYFSTDRNNLHFQILEDQIREIRLRSTLKSFLSKLNQEDCFVQVHRAFVVNKSMIKSMHLKGKNKHVVLDGIDGKIPVGDSFVSNLK